MVGADDSLGIVAGTFQAIGYAFYIRAERLGLITPNPLSWLMFAYGTGVVVVLEAGLGARWTLLLLPSVCAISSIFVAVRASRSKAGSQPVASRDRWAFVADVILTATYLLVNFAQSSGVASREALYWTNLAALACVNITNATSFVPIIRSTFERPDDERPAAWLVWSFAYAILAVATYREIGVSVLLLYPACCIGLHLTIALLSTRPCNRALLG